MKLDEFNNYDVMSSAVYSLTSGAYKYGLDLKVQSNNLANMNTDGFREQKAVHSFVLQRGPQGTTAYPVEGPSYMSTEQGAIVQTGRSLDVALVGEGFFKVQTPLGVRYTRAGHFRVNADNTLVDSNNNPVLSNDGQVIAFEEGDSEFVINGDGTILVDGAERGQIGFVNFSNTNNLIRVGANLFKSDQVEIPAENTSVVQGGVEQGNVNSIKSVTQMVEGQRLHQMCLELISQMNGSERAALKTYAKIGG